MKPKKAGKPEPEVKVFTAEAAKLELKLGDKEPALLPCQYSTKTCGKET